MRRGRRLSAAGQLGLGDREPRLTPARVGEHADWIAITAGADHTCGLRAGGALECWGAGDRGQLARPYASAADPGGACFAP